MARQKMTVKCDCGKKVSGFGRKHLDMNLMIHNKTSVRHHDVMKLLREKGLR
ncbi:MAG: hypothetical protein HY051_02065 [Candidatus Aenigmarchaeota archaeon]|nr:hypothetical protein [Candidatus Aenigmarchaeota archaeon]